MQYLQRSVDAGTTVLWLHEITAPAREYFHHGLADLDRRFGRFYGIGLCTRSECDMAQFSQTMIGAPELGLAAGAAGFGAMTGAVH